MALETLEQLSNDLFIGWLLSCGKAPGCGYIFAEEQSLSFTQLLCKVIQQAYMGR
jgi:hypothetical protein